MTNEKVVYLADGVEYYPDSNELLLIRCPKCGSENYAPAVCSGVCVWCGFNGYDLLKEGNKELKE
jgi:ribosomal protein L37E